MDSGPLNQGANIAPRVYSPPRNERFEQYLREFRSIPSLGDKMDAALEGKRLAWAEVYE